MEEDNQYPVASPSKIPKKIAPEKYVDAYSNASYTEDVEYNEVPSAKKRGRPPKKSKLSCGACTFVAKDLKEMSSHLAKNHREVLQFACPHCHALFTQKGNLTTHMLTHQIERPYACTECNFTAVQKNNLLVHIRKHTNEKPYECSDCDYRAAQLGNLRGHYMRKHSHQSNNIYKKQNYSVTMFECPKCTFACKKQNLMTRHLRLYHEEDPVEAVVEDGEAYEMEPGVVIEVIKSEPE